MKVKIFLSTGNGIRKKSYENQSFSAKTHHDTHHN